jgi:hypothetical protein
VRENPMRRRLQFRAFIFNEDSAESAAPLPLKKPTRLNDPSRITLVLILIKAILLLASVEFPP